MINAMMVILFLSDTHEGSAHDKAIVDALPYPLPPGSLLLEDRGFQGLELPDVTHIRPIKKPKGGTLTDEQKAFNRQVSRQRIPIEHVISSVKRCRTTKDTIRLWKEDVRDLVMEVACALHNFRVTRTPWPSSLP